MSKRPLLRLAPLCDPDDFQAALYDDESLTLAELLQRAPALSTEPVAAALLQRPLSQLIITPVEVGPECGLYRPPGLRVDRQPQVPALLSPEPTAPELPEPAATVPAITPYVHLRESAAARRCAAVRGTGGAVAAGGGTAVARRWLTLKAIPPVGKSARP